MERIASESATTIDDRARTVALLTGGGDRPYVLGLCGSLTAAGIQLEVVGSDFLDCPELRTNPCIRFLNLRGDMSADSTVSRKVTRVVRYYVRLLKYVFTAKPTIFHVLWNGKLEYFDRTVLPLLLKLLGKRIIRTIHNVNTGQRDGTDGVLNRITLRYQYRMSDHLFVHTQKMKEELESAYAVPGKRVSVIPFGLNNTVPDSGMPGSEARRRLGLDPGAKVVLFFGNIAPYKGLEYLIAAFESVIKVVPDCRLVVAGRPKGSEQYWANIERDIDRLGLAPYVTRRIEYVPDAETEIYFKAADVLALPYLYVFQSGVLFLAYNFGLPVIASDVASLKDDIVQERTGLVCPPADPVALAQAIVRFFGSRLYGELVEGRKEIRRFAQERYAWDNVAEVTTRQYAALFPATRSNPACDQKL